MQGGYRQPLIVDNINVKDYTQKELRNKVAICLQKAELFSGTIKDNIKWGKEDATDEEVDEVAENIWGAVADDNELSNVLNSTIEWYAKHYIAEHFNK